MNNRVTFKTLRKITFVAGGTRNRAGCSILEWIRARKVKLETIRCRGRIGRIWQLIGFYELGTKRGIESKVLNLRKLELFSSLPSWIMKLSLFIGVWIIMNNKEFGLCRIYYPYYSQNCYTFGFLCVSLLHVVTLLSLYI